ncbi:maleylpyruvate isomerase family mycothiol-dependent enzyme [Nonomuraea sp. NPDC005650]|uniref:maleylpyruvate isomerase family mycothiol-dependent enzyme n=1 Tax=Nonomuraea sp. NPDC005650 TaxID=3157045 RepID=UPI0033BCE2FE
MEPAARFHRETRAFQEAARQAAGAAPAVPSCPGWSVADLLIHLGAVHRSVFSIITDRLDRPPDASDLSFAGLPPDLTGWPDPQNAPNLGPIRDEVLDWFEEGAARLGALFDERDADDPSWTWSKEQTVGFWVRMQTIEAAIHRWDAENAVGVPHPIAEDVAADAIAQTFEVMAPARREWTGAPAGAGERFRFRRTDGEGDWAVHFDGRDVRLSPGSDGGRSDVELAGSASDLMLFLWRRIPADGLDVRGDKSMLDRYFALVPPV